MAVPKYDELMKPLLTAVQDGQAYKIKDLYGSVAHQLKIGPEDISEMLPSGRQTVFRNRIGWAKTYLKKAGLIDSPARATVVITDAGKKVLQEDPDKIDAKYLQQFPSFKDFASAMPAENKTDDDATDSQAFDLTPDDQLENAYKEINSSLAEDLLNEVMKITPYTFEKMVVDLLSKMGYGTVAYGSHATVASGDDGIDGVIMEDMLTALMFSQYRLKVFQDHRLYIKPVVLFKSKTIAESKEFEQRFYELVRTLTGAMLERIVEASPLAEVARMAEYYAAKDIGFDELAQELREEFSPDHCISVNDDKEASERQLLLNSLESLDNPYRAIFEVKKLDEGWDVLNLFDIVRLYETRDASRGKPGASTIAEAQLIGRGARYCPFVINEDDEKYKRKYDGDVDNPLRVCEELYYHCQYDSRYIDELNKALIATGIMPESQTEVHYVLKDEFKKDEIYKTGIVQSFVGAIAGKHGDGLFVTTARFSQKAMDYAQTHHIILIDGDRLAHLMIDANFCVSVRKTFEIKDIDTDALNEYQDE